MNRPLERWLDSDEAPPEVVELLRVGRPAAALGREARLRSQRRLRALAAAPASLATWFWLQNVALGAALGAATVGGSVLVRERLSAPPAAVGAPDAVATERSEAKPRASSLKSAPPPVVDSAPREREESAPTASYRGGSTDELAQELALLERARALLPTRPEAALSTLDAHRRKFERGSLVIERELLGIDALVRLGRQDEAEVRARALRTRAPRSLYERRIEELIGKRSSQ
jgi:hypothetical protein